MYITALNTRKKEGFALKFSSQKIILPSIGCPGRKSQYLYPRAFLRVKTDNFGRRSRCWLLLLLAIVFTRHKNLHDAKKVAGYKPFLFVQTSPRVACL
jgi:hypothetical protein